VTLEVKFKNDRPMRLRRGRLVELHGAGPSTAASDPALDRIAAGGWMRTYGVGEARLEQLRAAAQARATRPVPDLNQYSRLRLPPQADAAATERELRRLGSVEAVYRVPDAAPPPAPIDYNNPPGPYQRYLDAAPAGIDARHAWSLPDGRGAGVRVCDVEYDWNPDHADLNSATLLAPITASPFGTDHGTAVIGVLGAKNNGWGTTGVAEGADLAFTSVYDESGFNLPAAILRCVAATVPGDVILLEQQTNGPSGGSHYVPIEWYKPYYDAVVFAVGSGRVVVEAGGNGGENLDSLLYQTGNGGHYPFLAASDSGAIIVGAGKSPAYAADQIRSRESFSNYGARIDIQGWGDSVVTTGYGDLYNLEGPDYLYTSSFSGTSSASAIIAATAAVVQGAYKSRFGVAATPSVMRNLLRATGTLQQGADHIGPLPNLRCALDSLISLAIDTPDVVSIGSVMSSLTANPPTASQPITYTWEIAGQPPITHTAGLTDATIITWPGPGAQTITVTATSGCGLPVVATKTVTVVRASVFLPLVTR
jgi:hypothetical protein